MIKISYAILMMIIAFIMMTMALTVSNHLAVTLGTIAIGYLALERYSDYETIKSFDELREDTSNCDTAEELIEIFRKFKKSNEIK